ncbi:MAG: 50S ribosomal protein L11 methyltransferase [Polyangiaceae bacterium]
MIADSTRLDAYVAALEATVRPGAVVIDVGTGTGILALVACRLGASRVYGVDNNHAIEVARELARENGFADRIELSRQDVRSVALPERGDVVVADLRGAMPMAGASLAAVAHVRENLLAPGGVLIPKQDRLFGAVVESPSFYERAVGRLAAGGVTLVAMRSRLANTVYFDRARSIQPCDLLTPAALWASIDYSTVVPKTIHGRAEWCSARDGVGHGLLLWFDALLAEGCEFSTRPGAVNVVYPQVFLPWTEPVGLRQGETVEASLWASHDGKAWSWNTVVRGQMRREPLAFKQSSFLAELTRPGGPGAGASQVDSP